MDEELVEWQIRDSNGMILPWWTHPFLDELKKWDLSDKALLEFGAGKGTAWLRHRSKWVDSIESDLAWYAKAQYQCDKYSLRNGAIYAAQLPDGVQERKSEYFSLIPEGKQYDIISVDGIWRYECLQWAIDHFKGRAGIIIADNWQQDFVWISEAAEALMAPYPIHRYFQPGHVNHAGKPWNTVYWEI